MMNVPQNKLRLQTVPPLTGSTSRGNKLTPEAPLRRNGKQPAGRLPQDSIARNSFKIPILLTGKHALVRAGIRSLVQKMPQVEVLGEASDDDEAVQLVKMHRPRVVLMNIAMPGMNGLEAIARVTKEFPDVRVLILTKYSSEECVLHALRAGAAGYMLTDATASELEFALSSVAEGKDYLSPAISRYVVEDHRRRSVERTSPREQLTLRQREILQLIAEGLTTNAMSRKLHISVKTVETHRAEVMRRLDIHNIAGLVRFVLSAGLIADNRPAAAASR